MTRAHRAASSQAQPDLRPEQKLCTKQFVLAMVGLVAIQVRPCHPCMAPTMYTEPAERSPLGLGSDLMPRQGNTESYCNRVAAMARTQERLRAQFVSYVPEME